MPIDYSNHFNQLADSPFSSWLPELSAQVEQALKPTTHGDVPRWLEMLYQLPRITPSSIDLNADALRIGSADDISTEQKEQLTELLMQFQPWRKGPFSLFGIHIDTEWRSDWKWQRLADAIAPLTGRTVLDVGSGNGYYGWRMLGAGAEMVVGIDPTLRYLMQYALIDHFLTGGPGTPYGTNVVFPLRLEHLTQPVPAFDSVFSMGVIYHQRDHIGHIHQLLSHLKPGGELILEGLVIEGQAGACLHPKGRYAKMHNVHAIPSTATMAGWLKSAGLENIQLVDVSVTTLEEQRKTDWMVFESLVDYLDPDDRSRTIEGYPAPIRATFIANKQEG
jgi:tRNA (mo5U34)-methyltransferase